jgi:hypothetical protein
MSKTWSYTRVPPAAGRCGCVSFSIGGNPPFLTRYGKGPGPQTRAAVYPPGIAYPGREPGAGSREPGAGSWELGAGSWELGAGHKKTPGDFPRGAVRGDGPLDQVHTGDHLVADHLPGGFGGGFVHAVRDLGPNGVDVGGVAVF